MDEQRYKDRIQALEDELALEKARAEHWRSLYLSANQKRFGRSIESSHQLGLDLFDEAELENLNQLTASYISGRNADVPPATMYSDSSRIASRILCR